MNRFKIKTEVRFSDNALDTLHEFVGVNAVIITDAFMVKSGVADKIAEKLKNCKSVHIFGDVVPNPPIELITEGLHFLKNTDADVVIALGGGSSIDAAKAVVLMAKRGLEKKDLKLVAIPTTSGTGSEVTQFAVITDNEKGVKYPLVDEEMLPDFAILDPTLVVSAPPGVTADTGLDVITHAIEAYVSIHANDASDALSEKALRIAFRYLPKAFRNGADLKARESMHSASCLAGMAFNEVNLGVNHSIAHGLGAKFHIPHGRANAMLLAHVVEYNADLENSFGTEGTHAAKKYAEVAKILGLPHSNIRVSVTNLVDEISFLCRMMKVPATLGEAGVTKEEYLSVKDEMIDAIMQDACLEANPRPVTREDVEMILNKLAVF